MQAPIQEQLIHTSKTMIFVLRGFFIFFLIIALLPWLFPTLPIAQFFMSFFSIFHHMDSGQANYYFMHLSAISRLLGIAGAYISLLPVLLGAWMMIHLAKNYITREVFNVKNAKTYRNLGVLYLLSALLLQPLAQVLFTLSISFIHDHLGQRFIAISVDINNLIQIFFAIVLIVIGHVMQLGHKIQEESTLTI